MEIQAAVLGEVGEQFRIETVDLGVPAADEVIVEIAGSGICHTDVAVQAGHLPFPLPGVLGHEGSGTVLEVGTNVDSVAPGDKVAISFNSCGECAQCDKGAPAYCLRFMEYNFGGVRADGSAAVTHAGKSLGGNFFGQSSLATHVIAHERNVVKVPDDVPIELIGPLGCGIQTGAGAVMNSLDIQHAAALAVAGGGTVGLAAVLAAVVRGAALIIVVEPHESRRKLALDLGATHAIDPSAAPISEQIRAIVPDGVEYAIDTTAQLPVLEQLLGSLGARGVLGMIGVPADPAAALPVALIPAVLQGLTIRGVTEGDADPQAFIPYLLDLYREGKFPFHKLISTMPLSRINEAIAAQHRGDAVKVVLTTH
ncbi:NAD(P)-dependent alcohol dehydrogenase [Nocardia sp. NPDC004860]|uniref:NAD(P)-dependent alcohol dehydrogenase n=1 Tax=Nocardia sp. NPDC004860 TaxID=3154557 RepID=UPI0033AAAA90